MVKSSLAVFGVGMGAMFVLLYAAMTYEPAFMSDDDDGRTYTRLSCAPANRELKFGYTCADILEAAKIARDDARVIEAAKGSDLYLVGYAFVDDAGPGGVSQSEDPKHYPFLNFFSTADKRLVSVWADLESRVAVEIYR